MKIGRVTISDRASAGICEDRSGPEIDRVLRETFGAPLEFVPAIVPDEVEVIPAIHKGISHLRGEDPHGRSDAHPSTS